MPISIQCASCQTRLRAPDNLAGKKVKCSKCGQAIPVPGTPAAVAAAPPPPVPPRPPAPPGIREAAGSARAPAPPAPGPARAAAPPTPASSLPVPSFDDLGVPGKLRRTIEEELAGERMVWMGRPTPESYRSKSWIAMWAGLGICILAGAGAAFAFMKVQETTQALVVAGVVGALVLFLGLPLLTMPFWIGFLMKFRDCYVLTATRAIVFDNEQIVKAVVKPYSVEQLHDRELRVNADGTGSIIFGTEVLDLGTRTSIKTKDEKRYNRKVRVTYIKTKREKANKSVGFIDIADVEAVEALMRQVMKLPPPASEEID